MTKTMLILALFGMALALPMVGCKGEQKSQEQLDKDAASAIAEVNKCISGQDLDQADKHLKALEADKAKYSEALQKQIETARAGLDTAKKAAKGLKIPKIGG